MQKQSLLFNINKVMVGALSKFNLNCGSHCFICMVGHSNRDMCPWDDASVQRGCPEILTLNCGPAYENVFCWKFVTLACQVFFGGFSWVFNFRILSLCWSLQNPTS